MWKNLILVFNVLITLVRWWAVWLLGDSMLNHLSRCLNKNIYFHQAHGGEIYNFPSTPGEVFRRDRLTKDEGELKCVPAANGNPATCTATSSSQETVGGNFDYNWDAVDTNTFYDPPPVCSNPSDPSCTWWGTWIDSGPTLKTSTYTRYDPILSSVGYWRLTIPYI